MGTGAVLVLVVAASPLPADAQPEAPAARDGGIVTPVTGPATAAGSIADAAAMARFLDRLMMAESGGRDTAANPRSTALGPFQFIESTFLDVARRHLAAETAGLTAAQTLALRVNRAMARRAAEAYTRENADALVTAGLPATFSNLRLAFLLGPGGAIRLLRSEPTAPAIRVLGAGVVQANPFMAGLTAADLVAWSERNLAASDLSGRNLAATPAPPLQKARPAIVVRCNQRLASCRRWVSLASSRVTRQAAASSGRHKSRR
ncbi:MAG: hypothetical protein SFW09_13765 [Hyphomicrobiaceae bacterium]|nr:hypothetical protein [Hyphomicrobiaceae bacterium]